ncbi:hypothetical protein ACFE04_003256 [Oxalis oulophora]
MLSVIRKNPFEYESLLDESSVSLLGSRKLDSPRSMPVQRLEKKQEVKNPRNSQVKPTKKVKSDHNNNQHPLFSLFNTPKKSKKKTTTTTSKPEFSRYLEYLKEGGIWDLNSDMPGMLGKCVKSSTFGLSADEFDSRADALQRPTSSTHRLCLPS